jgi:hypothetical protein
MEDGLLPVSNILIGKFFMNVNNPIFRAKWER